MRTCSTIQEALAYKPFYIIQLGGLYYAYLETEKTECFYFWRKVDRSFFVDEDGEESARPCEIGAHARYVEKHQTEMKNAI